MRASLRALRWAVVAVVVLGGIAAVGLSIGAAVLRRSVRSEQVVASYLEKALGREVRIRTVEVGWWPRLELRLGGVSIARTPRDAGTLRSEVVHARVRLLPLLRGRFVVDQIVLRRPTALVVREADGRLSFADVLGQAGPSSPLEAGGLTPIVMSVVIRRAKVVDGELTLVDHTASPEPVTVHLSDLHADIDGLRPGQVPRLRAGATLGSGQLSLEGRLGTPGAGGVPLTASLAIRTVDISPLLPLAPASWRRHVRHGLLGSDLSIERRPGGATLVRGTVRLERARLGGDGYDLAGTIAGRIDGIARGGNVRAEASLRLAPTSFAAGDLAVEGDTAIRAGVHAHGARSLSHLEIDATRALCRHGTVFRKGAGTPLVLRGDLVRNGERLLIRDLSGEVDGIPLAGTVQVDPARPRQPSPVAIHVGPAVIPLPTLAKLLPTTAPLALRGTATLSDADIRRRPDASRPWQVTMRFGLAGAAVAVPLADGGTYAIEEVSGDVQVEPGLLTVRRGRATLPTGGPIAFAGEAKEFMGMLSGDPARPRAEVQLDIETKDLDLGRLLAPPAGGGSPHEPSRAHAERAFLQRLVVTGAEVRATRVLWGTTTLKNARGTLAYDPPTLRLADTTFTTYGGQVRLDGTLSLADDATFALETSIRGAHLRDFVATEPEAATFDATFRISGRRDDLGAWDRTLTGEGKAAAQNGILPSFNLLQAIARALSRVVPFLPADRVASLGAHNRFSRAEKTFRVRDGRVRSDDLSVVTDDYLLRAAGSVGLDGTLDYAAKATLTTTGIQKLFAAAAVPIPGASALKTYPFPVHIAGTLASPSVVVDAATLSTGPLRALLGGAGGAARSIEHGADKLMKDLGDLLDPWGGARDR